LIRKSNLLQSEVAERNGLPLEDMRRSNGEGVWSWNKDGTGGDADAPVGMAAPDVSAIAALEQSAEKSSY